MDGPLSQDETIRLSLIAMSHGTQPGARYMEELIVQMDSIAKDIALSPPQDPDRLWYERGKYGTRGLYCQYVLARSRIRQKWESLGIWNPSWGVPGLCREDASDYPELWCWPWQSQEHVQATQSSMEAVLAAVRARSGRRSMDKFEPPRWQLPLPHTTTPDQAEQFLTTRPWFAFGLEVREELVRLTRLEYLQHPNPNNLTAEKIVAKRWIDRGIWSKSWDLPDEGGLKSAPGWRWPKEVPDNATSLELEHVVGLIISEEERSIMDAIQRSDRASPEPFELSDVGMRSNIVDRGGAIDPYFYGHARFRFPNANPGQPTAPWPHRQNANAGPSNHGNGGV